MGHRDGKRDALPGHPKIWLVFAGTGVLTVLWLLGYHAIVEGAVFGTLLFLANTVVDKTIGGQK